MAKRLLSTQKIVNLNADPASGSAGEIYYNTSSNSFKYYNGSSWVDLSSGGSGNSFTTIDVPNGTDPVADTSSDTLTITESNGVILTGNSTTDTIDISTNATHLNTASTIVSRDSSQSFDITGIDFDTSDTITSAVGRAHWDDGEGTLSLGLKGGNINLKVGQENLALCYNGTGLTINKGSVVYISGAQGQRPSITLSDADTEVGSSKTFGVVAENIANGAEGFVCTFGIVSGIDTSAFTVGQSLWLSSTAGQLTNVVPTQPAHSVFIGYCLHVNQSSGRIFVNPQNGYELQELHNVLVSSLGDNHILSYDNETSLWKNQGLAAAIQEIDGASSGIDADLLDGQHGTYYAPINSPTFTGIVTVPTPSNSTDAVTKGYVDAIAQGLHIHASVQTATTSNISDLSNPGATIDGVTLTNNMRVLVKNQNTTSQNGIYVYNSSTGALTRATDFDTSSETNGGDFVFVTGGTQNDNTGWVQTETVSTLGTDPIIFQQFSGAGTYTAGTGVSLAGNQFSNSGVLSVNGSTGAITNIATTTSNLSQFSSTTSAQLASILSDETGFHTGAKTVFSIGPTLGSLTGSGNYSITFTGGDNQGGSGYFDFIKVESTATGVSNPNKSFRLNSSGGLEIVNSAYDGVIFSLSNSGTVNLSGPLFSGAITIESNALVDTTVTSITSNSATIINSISASTYRSAEYLIQVSQGSKYTVSKIIMIHDGTTAHITEYSLIELGASRIPLTISGTISGGNVVLEATITDASSTNATVKVLKTAIVV